ncbi:MAG: damage-inducible protein CinA [Gammaproteobacteria bacterium]|nr:MAG: damage-inducible protein CinA [Gammaproteobacteria bacterium]
MDELQALATRIAHRLGEQHQRLATAESCTGGWIAKVLTDIAGSSDWFERGLVTYSNDAKQELLGVPEALIEAHGAVSEPVVAAMAHGLREHTGVDITLAVSGVAGPTGGTPDKPVGTVWFAWDHGTTRTECVHFAGDREAVRRQAVEHALHGLLGLIDAA